MSNEYDNMRDEFIDGYVQVYTGDGKGKTTAALGLALRASGAGCGVFVGQFIKAGKYSEIAVLENLPGVVCRQYGKGCFIHRNASDEDRAIAKQGVADAKKEMQSGAYRVVILDEANVAVQLGLLDVSDLIGMVDARPADVELVFTGRGAPEELIDRADLVTEMREVKHYYRKGVMARRGIES